MKDGEGVAFEPGFYWVVKNGETRIAEWLDSGGGWEWNFTRAEIARRVDRVIGRIDQPQQ